MVDLAEELAMERKETKQIIRRENDQLRAEDVKLRKEDEKLRAEDGKLRDEVAKLRRELRKAKLEMKTTTRQRDQNATIELKEIVDTRIKEYLMGKLNFRK